MNPNLLSINDVMTIDLLERMAGELRNAADTERDGNRYLSYRRASLCCELLALDLRQGLPWHVGSPVEVREPMPRYQGGKRAYQAKDAVPK